MHRSYLLPVVGLTLLVCPALASDLDVHSAARLGAVDTVAELLETNPALANAQNPAGETPLHHAAANHHADVIYLLIAYGADVNAADALGVTALHLVAGSPDRKLIENLIATGADVHAADAHGDTALHVAARRFRPEALGALLEAGADPVVPNDLGDTPLHVLGANVRVLNADVHTRLLDMAAQLIAAGADASIIADGLPALQEPPQAPAEPSRDTWTDYDDIGPTLLDYETTYPDLAKRYDLGLSYQGRHLWAIRISDNVLVEEDEPGFKYIATMHGDEIVGTKMCMLLIEYLLTNYGTDPQATTIIDEVELWIVPLMNPDGYDRSNRTRVNAQGIDLNRNFPEWINGDENDPTGRATEVQVIMNWSFQHSFTCSANLHGGVMVVNYPFDNDGMGSVYSPTPDEDMFVYISEQYSQHNRPMWEGDWYHGITNGAAWYSIDGGMQDWNYRYMGNNEVTIELSDIKEPPASTIPDFWADNRQSMLSYIQTCLIGVRGLVTDIDTGEPLAATVTVVGRDHNIYTDPEVGDYHRMLMPGDYELQFVADGYDPVTVPVTVNSGDATVLDVQLGPAPVLTYPNGGEALPANAPVNVTWTGNGNAQFQLQYTSNFAETGLVTDDFEDGDLGDDYTLGGDADWSVTSGTVHGGTYAAQAGDITHNQSTWMTRSAGAGAVSFWYRVSSESNYDFFNFYIDDVRELHVSGYSGWQYFNTTLPAGTHELKWEYTKDVSVNGGSDTAWIDDLELTVDLTAWENIVALTDVGATSYAWTPTELGSDHKVRVRAYYGDGAYGYWDESDATFAVVEGQFVLGDMNCDGAVDFDDINPFVLALSGQAGYEAAYPDCNWLHADADQDGDVDFDDINPFVALIGS